MSFLVEKNNNNEGLVYEFLNSNFIGLISEIILSQLK